MFYRYISALMVVGIMAGQVYASPTVFVRVDPNNTIPGVTAYSVYVNGDGLDWNVAAMKVDLTAGSVYNDPVFDAYTPQSTFWPLIPELEWDTWFGVPGDSTSGIAGGAGDLGGGLLNIGGTGVDAVSVSWFNTSLTDTALTRIANISLTDDADGSWQLAVGFGSGVFLDISGPIALLPEPTVLSLMGLGGLCLLRRS